MQRDALSDRLMVTPLLDDDQIGAASIDLRLGTEFVEVRRREATAIDPLEQKGHESVTQLEDTVFVTLGERFILHPRQFVLGATLEFIRLPLDMAGHVLGRSSWGRLGLVVATAVVVQPGFAGVLTLELANEGSVPIHLYPGFRVAQLQLWTADSPCELVGDTTRSRYEVPLGPESVHIAWKPAEVARIRKIGEHLSGRQRGS